MAISIISLVISILALAISILIWKRDFSVRRYNVADKLLLEIHKILLQYPEYSDPELIKDALNNSDSKIKYRYDNFAAIVWNFLETLYEAYGKGLEKSSFYGVMRTLGNLHREWFFQEKNLSCYNQDLIKFLRIKRD